MRNFELTGTGPELAARFDRGPPAWDATVGTYQWTEDRNQNEEPQCDQQCDHSLHLFRFRSKSPACQRPCLSSRGGGTRTACATPFTSLAPAGLSCLLSHSDIASSGGRPTRISFLVVPDCQVNNDCDNDNCRDDPGQHLPPPRFLQSLDRRSSNVPRTPGEELMPWPRPPRVPLPNHQNTVRIDAVREICPNRERWSGAIPRELRMAVTAGNGGAISGICRRTDAVTARSAPRQPMVHSVLLSSAVPTKPVR